MFIAQIGAIIKILLSQTDGRTDGRTAVPVVAIAGHDVVIVGLRPRGAAGGVGEVRGVWLEMLVMLLGLVVLLGLVGLVLAWRGTGSFRNTNSSHYR